MRGRQQAGAPAALLLRPAAPRRARPSCSSRRHRVGEAVLALPDLEDQRGLGRGPGQGRHDRHPGNAPLARVSVAVGMTVGGLQMHMPDAPGQGRHDLHQRRRTMPAMRQRGMAGVERHHQRGGPASPPDGSVGQDRRRRTSPAPLCSRPLRSAPAPARRARPRPRTDRPAAAGKSGRACAERRSRGRIARCARTGQGPGACASDGLRSGHGDATLRKSRS